MSVLVRCWAPTDVPSVRHIAWTTWLATYAGFIPEADMRAFFDEYYTPGILAAYCADEHARGFLAESEAVAAGFAKTVLNRQDGRFYLSSLYVLPEYQGQGIGSRLLRASEEFALTLGATEVWLGVMTQNTASVEWYRRIGFRFEREEPFMMGQTTVPHLIGYRPIAQPSPTAGNHT
ncbi:MAG: GNAT family N-acetyltransferase [Gemmatimonadetes bacterium]|nr:GNAT family N-acetyltransferase [Gemmatimonadota bacterium]